MIEEDNQGPLFVRFTVYSKLYDNLNRLAWHDAGTYDASKNTGGPHAHMRFAPVGQFGANNGLDVARDLLEPIKAAYPALSYADLWQFAGAVSIYNSGGPSELKWRPGRADASDAESVANKAPIPDGVLPAPSSTGNDMRDTFYRMGFSEPKEIVALMGIFYLPSLTFIRRYDFFS